MLKLHQNGWHINAERETEVLILKAYNVVYGVFTTTAPMSLKRPVKLQNAKV